MAKFETKYSCGDKVWCYYDHPMELTIGQIRVKYTSTPGIDGSIFDNYKAVDSYEEEYMCVETGIGSGRVYSLDKLYDSKDECIAGNQELVEKQRKIDEQNRIYEEGRRLRKKASLLAELAEIEEIEKKRSV